MNFQTIYKQQKNIYRNIKRGGFFFKKEQPTTENIDTENTSNKPDFSATELKFNVQYNKHESNNKMLTDNIINLEDYKNLKTLDLSGIFINQQNMETLSTKIGDLKNLEQLSLYDISNQLDTNPYINKLLSNLPKTLKILNLGGNDIKNDISEYNTTGNDVTISGLFKIINQLKSLETLNLSHNSINDAGVKELQIIKDLNLTNLDLSGNSEIKDESIPVILEHFPSLEILNLSSTRITENGIEKILTILKKNDENENENEKKILLKEVILKNLDINDDTTTINNLNKYLTQRQPFIN